MSSLRRMAGVRWAFNFTSWEPTQEEWITASRCVQVEEKERIGKFVFKKDGKSAMAGRLLLRKVVSEHLKAPWNSFTLTRTDRGKPVLEENGSEVIHSNFNFNASHQGDMAVLASEREWLCGIDVMKVDRKSATSVLEFFRIMERQFTPYEWRTIRSVGTEQQQLEMFYRFWCLKESYIKAIGIGLGFNLQRAEFHVKTLRLGVSKNTDDTLLYLDGKLTEDWVFQETRLDEKHFVAVALQRPSQAPASDVPLMPSFKFLTFQELTESTIPLLPSDLEYWKTFEKKKNAPNNWKP